jgi:hypothetical protein
MGFRRAEQQHGGNFAGNAGKRGVGGGEWRGGQAASKAGGVRARVFYVESLHDTLTMHVGTDSSYTTSSSGELIVKSVSNLQNDTLRMRDVGGEYYCPDGEGVYRITVEGDYLTFFLITDPCNNRSEALNGTKFRQTESK